LATNSDIDRVRDAADLVALIGEHMPLRPKGREHIGLCPFHDDHSPSLTVVTHKDNAFYKCHSCGASGDVFNFVMEYHKMTFPEALRYLAERTGVTLSPTTRRPAQDTGPSHADLRRANEVAAGFYRDTLKRGRHGAEARAMTAARGIDDETAEAFMIGAAPPEWDELAQHCRGRRISRDLLQAAGLVKPRSDGSGCYDVFRNRLIFPICDELGRPVAFGGRQVPGQAAHHRGGPRHRDRGVHRCRGVPPGGPAQCRGHAGHGAHPRSRADAQADVRRGRARL
jgi:DNA primase